MGKERIVSVMRLLDELLAASKQAEGGAAAAEAPVEPAAAGETPGLVGGNPPDAAQGMAGDPDVDMAELELDDEQALLLAERVAPPKAEGKADEHFRERLQAPAARLRNGRLRVDSKKLLVRKDKDKPGKNNNTKVS